MARRSHRETRPPSPVEHGAVRKPWARCLRIALVYPNVYRLGMSNLGFQTVYRLLNAMEGVLCERVFLPEPSAGMPLSVESSQPLDRFHVVAFSISFENDFPGMLHILERAGLPLASAQRGSPHPLVVAGGVACWLNPEPIAAFIDVFLLGEAEVFITDFVAAVDTTATRSDLLLRIAQTVPGAYVPGFYETAYLPHGPIGRFTPTADVPDRIRPPWVADLNNHPTRSAIVSDQSAFDDTYLVEIGRGCPHGCRFCSAGFLYRPPRFRDTGVLAETISAGTQWTRRIGLVGAAVSDLPGLGALCQLPSLSGLRLSFSSLRADALTPTLIDILRKNRVKTATIAPDAGSERMRRVINKGITESEILTAAGDLVAGGIPNLKLYFMIGLPTETAEDVTAIIDLCAKIRECWLAASRRVGHIGTIQVSVNSFVPKPVTPFQWVGMDDKKNLKQKIKMLREALQPVPNVRLKVESLNESVIQAILSRGDRRLSHVLRRISAGTPWASALSAEGLDSDFYATRQRPTDELLPWHFIDHGLSSGFLQHEYTRALSAKPSPPCPIVNCSRCGVCPS
ncbi:MAG: radical SAM protein [Pseudomonadota bacterium]